MTEETDPIEPDEDLLRRIVNKPDYVNLSLAMPVIRIAFRPTKNDTRGISLYRELFASAQDVAESGTNPAGYWVARMPLRDIQAIGLTAVPEPMPPLPGHCCIPEIRCDTKDATEDQQLALARLASKALVVTPKAK